MKLTKQNYFHPEMMRQFWSVSQFKQFDKCEAAALAELEGKHTRDMTTSLLVGSYVDAYFSGEMEDFFDEHPEVFKKDGSLKADYRHAETIIERIQSDQLFMDFLTGKEQVIRTARLFGVDWKIKMDVFNGERIVDLKIIKDMSDIYEEGYGRRPFIEFWGYDIQGAIYQKVEQLSSGRSEPLPFYLAVATKEKEPDIEVFQIPQHVLDTALHVVEAKIDRFDLVKQGLVDPIRCEHCEWCRRTKKLKRPKIYEGRENSNNG